MKLRLSLEERGAGSGAVAPVDPSGEVIARVKLESSKATSHSSSSASAPTLTCNLRRRNNRVLLGILSTTVFAFPPTFAAVGTDLGSTGSDLNEDTILEANLLHLPFLGKRCHFTRFGCADID